MNSEFNVFQNKLFLTAYRVAKVKHKEFHYEFTV